jgi:hypothetical protein
MTDGFLGKQKQRDTSLIFVIQLIIINYNKHKNMK